MNKTKGFTIIELVVVIFIIGLLITITIPPFLKQSPSKRLLIFTRQLASDLRLTQQIATANNWKYALKIQNDTSYKIIRCLNRIGNCSVELEKNVIKQVPPEDCDKSDPICNISDYIELDKGTSAISFEFNPDGWSSGGKIRIKLKNYSYSQGREIIVSPIRGRIRIEKY